MIVIDNAHLMCPTSWMLLENLTQEAQQVAFFLIVQSDDRGRIKITSDSMDSFELSWQAIDEDPAMKVRMVDIPQMNSDNIQSIINQNAQNYRKTFMREVDDMVKIVD